MKIAECTRCGEEYEYKFKKGLRCPDCRVVHHRERQREFLKENKALVQSNQQIDRAGRRERINQFKMDAGCIECGYDEHPAALDFDHVRGEKLFTIGNHISYSWDVIVAEIEKCEVVCANHHRIRTAERLIPKDFEIVI